MLDASPHKRRRLRQSASFGGKHVHQLGLGIGTAVGERALQVIPDTLVRVELRSIGGEGNEMKTRRALQQFLYRVSPMYGTVVQKDDDMAGDLAQQMAEECRDLFTLDVVFVELAIQGASETLRADCDSRDGRDSVVAVPMRNEWCLADRAPCFEHRRDEEKAGFVYKYEVGTQPDGVFFTRGQISRFHSSMATSLRSMARSSGFWWLQPNWCRSLPT